MSNIYIIIDLSPFQNIFSFIYLMVLLFPMKIKKFQKIDKKNTIIHLFRINNKTIFNNKLSIIIIIK